MSKEEMEKEKELATQKELVELGKILANKEHNQNLFDQTYFNLDKNLRTHLILIFIKNQYWK